MFPQAAAVHPKYLHPLRLLFKDSVSAITELNLTAFHFSFTADGSFVIGSALRLLRELAIAPCGVNHPGSLKYLARGCHFLEVLDVRTDQDSPCHSCRLPLLFSERCFGRLSRRTRLRRLSIDASATLSSLAFLRGCRVSELRLQMSPRFYAGLGRLLSANPHLSALTIEDSHLTLGRGPLATELAEVQTLRRLVVLSSNPTADGAASLFTELLEVRLPRLEILHVHYLDVRRVPQTATWIRQRRVVTTRMMYNYRSQSRGAYYFLKPCIGCYTSTFIGLARPRNRH
ncbi:hypothetical protein HPB48_000390 [Haemaphysalis longicornis]|uniref:Uncharacterized protein n=1 Tax=Haemaphysalis longicornis TaxID=44386 RepID=A0A9J6GLY0_HAELO|nr:hypothetical protein HPB48_000390 [Haemaphysalis longicornis]